MADVVIFKGYNTVQRGRRGANLEAVDEDKKYCFAHRERKDSDSFLSCHCSVQLMESEANHVQHS